MELDSIYEEVINYHINDYIIFEGVLRRDILEANGILNEEDNRNFIQKMWDKLLELINSAKYKVISISDSIINKAYDKKLEKYKKMVEDNKELLNKTDFTNFRCDCKLIDWSEGPDGKNYFTDNIVDIYLNKINCSINDLRTRDIDKLIKDGEDSVKNDKSTRENIYNNSIIDIKDLRIDKKCTEPEYLIKDLDLIINCIQTFRNYKLAVLKKIDKLQREVTQLKRNSKNDDEELKFANKAHKAFSLILKDTIIFFKAINKILATGISGQIKLITSAISYAKEQNGSSDSNDNKKEESQNSSYLYDMDYINAVTEAEIYELSL